MGSSPERVKIADIGDVIYYRQVKDYTDQTYDTSKDLQKAIQRGALTVIERTSTKTSIDTGHSNATVVQTAAPVIDMEAIKQAVREAMPKVSNTGESLKDIIPSLLNMIRQEMAASLANAPRTYSDDQGKKTEGMFSGPEYIPTVTTEGMVSNIQVKGKEMSGEGVTSNLSLLRKLKQQSK
jgi:hypothetical protein